MAKRGYPMRVPDSLCNAAIGVSRLVGLANPKNRAEEPSDAESIALFDVLEGYNGQKIYRFQCPPNVESLKAWDSRGSEIEASSYELTDQAAGKESRLGKLISLAVPASVGTFWVGATEGAKVRVGALETKAREVHRNCLMVNPGIDSLYPRWVYRHEEMRDGEEAASLQEGPVFSIITPLYNTPIGFFNDMIDSVISQTYGNWELVLVNASPENEELRQAIEGIQDERIVVVELDENKGISENTVEGIKASTGDYVAFLDHDDVIEPDLLMEYAKAVIDDPETDLLYCDEDSISHDGKRRFNPSFKFDFNLDLLLTHNYICHMLAVSRSALDQVNHYDSSVDGAQDYDLTLKVSRVARKMKHVPKMLYHWRQHAGSTNGGSTDVKPYVIEASVKVLSEYLQGDGIDASIIPTDIPCVFEEAYPRSAAKDVSVVVVYENSLQLLECLNSLSAAKTDIVGELIAVGPTINVADDFLAPFGIDSHGAGGANAAESYLSAVAEMPVRLIEMEDSAFASAANAGIEVATKDYILLVGADVRFTAESDAINKLRDYLCREDVGIVSAKAMAADGLVYHAGLCIKEDGSVGYLNQGFIEGMGGGYHGCAECACDYSAVDPSCIMFRKSDFEKLKGFSEEYKGQLAPSVDLSFQMRQAGKKIVVVPEAIVAILPVDGRWILGKSYILEGSKNHTKLWSKWDDGYRVDVFAHPNIDLSSSYFRLKV